VAYDANNNTKFDFGDTAIVGFIDDNTPLSSDSKLKFVNATTAVDEAWRRGKAVIYDVNNDNIFDTVDIPVTGTVPPLGTFLESDGCYGQQLRGRVLRMGEYMARSIPASGEQ